MKSKFLIIGFLSGVFPILALMFLLMPPEFKEKRAHFNCTYLCGSVDPMNHNLNRILWEPENGTFVCDCKNGALIEVISVLLKKPKHMTRQNEAMTVPAKLFITPRSGTGFLRKNGPNLHYGITR